MRHPKRPIFCFTCHTWHLLVGAACAMPLAAAWAQSGARPDQAIAAPEDPVAFEAVRPGPPASSVSRSAASEGENLPDLEKVTTWAIPPIRWGGNTGSNYAWNDNGAGIKNFSETQTLNLQAASYIYQPWFAQVTGNVGLLAGTSKLTGGSVSDATARSTSATYGGNLSLFPVSRFPFQAYLQTSDSRANANAATSQYTSTRMGATQSYRPESGSANYFASADRSVVSSSNVRSVVDALQGSFGTSIDNHALSGSARYSSSSGDVAGQGSRLLNLAATHSWRSDEDLTVASSANFSRNQISVLNGGGGLATNNTDLFQAGSSVSWTPDEDLPLTVTGGGNFLRMTTLTESARLALNNVSGYANAAYRFSNNLAATGGLTAVRTSANGLNQTALGQNAGISYSGNPLTFGEYSYNWGTGGSVSNQMISGAKSSRSVGAQIQHSLMRVINLEDQSSLSLNASQSFGLNNSSITGQTGVLTHAGGASWRLALGDRTLGMLSATLSDSMSTGAFASHFRSLSTQGNVQRQLTTRSAIGGGLNVTISQQLSKMNAPPQTAVPGTILTQATTNGTTNINGSAQMIYTHRSPFNVPNLMYSATFQANASQTNMRVLTGDPNALAWQTGKVFQQTADYRVGRLLFRGTASFATLNGKKNASVFFMIGRDFGDF